jgi:flagellin
MVASAKAAKGSIGMIDTAISSVNKQRSELGSTSNRLDHAVNNLTNVSANLTAGKDRIGLVTV